MATLGRGIHSANHHNLRRRRLILNAQKDLGVTVPIENLLDQEETCNIVSFKYQLSSTHEPLDKSVEENSLDDLNFPWDLQSQNGSEKYLKAVQVNTPYEVKIELSNITPTALIASQNKIDIHTQNNLLVDLREMIAGTAPVRWFFAGDDVVGGATQAGEEPGFVDLFAERIRWELRRFPDVIINAGHQDLALHKLGEQFEKKLLDFKPDVLMLMPGRRESLSGRLHLNTYRDNLRKLVKLLRKKGVTVVLQTPPPFLKSDQCEHVLDFDQNYLLAYYVETIREIASEHEFPLIDHFADWVQLPDSNLDIFIEANTQRITGSGQRRLCSLLFHELDLFDQQSTICRLCYSAG